MNSSENSIVIVYFNDSIITTIDEGVAFICDCLAYVLVSQIILFKELNVELCQSINVLTQKRVERIRFRCPISIINQNIKYQIVTINNDKDMRIMFRMYLQFQANISFIELNINFEEVVVA